jgi:tetratricopeptide (TPR) repeat protein
MAQPPTMLRVLVTSRHWQVFETFQRQFERTANELADREGDPSLEGLTVSKRQFERWYGGELKTRPYPALCRVLEAMFDRPVDVLLGPAGGEPPFPEPSGGQRRFDGIEFTGSPGLGDPVARDTLERQVAMAARRAFRFSAMSEGGSVGRETLDQLQQEVRRLTVAYPQLPLTTLLSDLIEMQDLSFRLLEHGRARPSQARELYLLSAITSGMLAKASHDLGDPHSATTQARTAYVCADNADHPAMRSWVRGLQSLITYWAGQHQEAAQYAALGAAAEPTGTTAVWLAGLHARASAALGDAASARDAIQRAEQARESLARDDLDDFSGIMTFTVPRQLYYAADALAQLPDAAEAEQRALAAVTAYRQAAPEEWAFGDQAGAHTDLALARVRAGRLDGLDEALRPVLDLPPEQRIHGVLTSVRQVHAALRDPRWLDAPETRQIIGEIEAFIATPAAALPR